MAELARFFDGKKFMWDGEEYENEDKANGAAQKYTDDGFEVEVCSEDGKSLVYTRRIVTEIEVQ
ncbi:MAG: hypothetical protein JW720_15460 [Sedimentisphaerales bacterium]|nr:hypothetical protein [Sedimentisphaerales bacterium]